mmetsp:Transcript_26001/g.46015  ORF Transcript_26001/g.46015 Transcript_26001/m.46015 type:complete len:233 (+) Transcript_26001:5961-6659(+)|eukprot:CAMPEP_0204913166 /NCGR_PEP_ID=MMETSP1397-20131031/11147_1 /ASSEMBLY_ACC=CAM_ASM_000891 /TAXON_ID=49980 /ORGANISM="Climacostomum Climacostomum virens, Strain Stock W-24" /LENGTH=232 /DNA_ID=CAMNT_0052084355 /DNA_START=111 /DNA_END=809 /DNA_ORIENTATION=+
MGLLCSTEDKTRSENHSVFKVELELGFSHHSPSVLIEAFKPKIQDGLMSASAFDELARRLHLLKNAQIRELLLKKANSGGDKLDGDGLLALSLLTSKGSKVERARALWSAFDHGGKETLTRSEFEHLLKLLVKAALDFTFEPASAAGGVVASRLTVYREDLQKRRDGFIRDMTTGFIGTQDSIQRTIFIARAQEQAMDLTTTLTIRRGIEKVKYEPTAFKSAFQRKKAELGV